MFDHPYSGLPDHAFWSPAVGRIHPAAVDPMVSGRFRIGRGDKIVTAGSCFARHVVRHLVARGLDHHVVECSPPLFSPEDAKLYGFGVYSARHGNIYTSRQLLQLIERAYGRFTPQAESWEVEGGLVDPFRPNIQPVPYASRAELLDDRARHLAAVRRAFGEMDVFIFTLGLTEYWYDRRDGAVYPLAPGVRGGSFDPALYGFASLSVDDVVDDMRKALNLVRTANPALRVVLTVSPVPLAATAACNHILQATCLSKAVLRIACDQLRREFDWVDYLPAFEIVTGTAARGRYVAEDLRSVTEEGVEHVMRVFFRHFVDPSAVAARPEPAPRSDVMAEFGTAAVAAAAVDCDEALLDRAY